MQAEYLTTTQAAKLCSVSRFSVLNWVKLGKLKAIATPGGHQRIPGKSVIELLRKSEISNRSPKVAGLCRPEVRCWQAKEVKASGRHRCAGCLVFKEKINRCFLAVKEFGREKVQCNTDCLSCSYFANHYPREKGVAEDMRQKAAAKLGSTFPRADKADIADFLKKGFYISGEYFSRIKNNFSGARIKKQV
jgi:excisionase family DNA binding protein